MRVNVYNEELTSRINVVTKTSENGILFYGLRFYLLSSDKLHHTAQDDDTSAVTFWFRSMRDLIDTFRSAYDVSMIKFLHPNREPEGL